MKYISKKHSKIILTEMCKRVGVSIDDFDFEEQGWFSKHAWLKRDQDDFQLWLSKFLIEKKYCKSKESFHEAGKIIAVYGWKTV